MPLDQVPEMNGQVYWPSGNTALYDAVSESIRFAEVTVQAGERVLVLIMTDGEENSSKKATATEIKNLIQSHEALGNWTFAYIGQNPEAWAKKVSLSSSNTGYYNVDNQRHNFQSAYSAVHSFRLRPQQQQVSGFFNTSRLN